MKMTSQAMKIIAGSAYTEQEIAQAFPDVDPGFIPFGSRLVVQLRSAKTKSKGGIILTGETQDAEKWNTQIAKVRRIGPVAFHSRDKLEPWPEGAWCQEGDYVRVPKYLQDRWEVEFDGYNVLFMIVNDLDILAKMTGNPLEVKAYI